MIPRSLRTHWTQFFFRSIEPTQYATLRIGLGFLILIYLLELLRFYTLHFSPEGWLGSRQDLFLDNSGSWSILFLVDSETAAYLLFLSAIGCSIAFTLGYKTSLSGWCTLIALVSLWNRNPLILDGDDAVLRIMLFYLLLSPCGSALSIDSRFSQQTKKAEIWPLRLIQLQLAFIYFVSGWVKFYSPQWDNGTVLQYVLVHPEYSRWDFSQLLIYPFFLYCLNAIAFSIKWWELLFPILLIHRKTRFLCLSVGVTFHLGLFAFMNLRWFSWIMLTCYLAFIPNRYFCRNKSPPQ